MALVSLVKTDYGYFKQTQTTKKLTGRLWGNSQSRWETHMRDRSRVAMWLQVAHGVRDAPLEGVPGVPQGRMGLGLHRGEVDPQKENGELLPEEGGKRKAARHSPHSALARGG